MRLASIADLGAGERATVVRVSDRDPAFLRYLAEMGIRPGAQVTVLEKSPFDGPVRLLVDGVEYGVGTAAAGQVFVKLKPE